MKRQLHVGAFRRNFLPPANEPGGLVKPRGGFWTSTYTPKAQFESAWVEFCHEIDFKRSVGQIFSVRNDARIMLIDGLEDLECALEKYGIPKFPFLRFPPFAGYNDRKLDFERIAADGYDGIHLTAVGQRQTRLSFPHNLYGWDTESTLWLTMRALRWQREIRLRKTERLANS